MLITFHIYSILTSHILKTVSHFAALYLFKSLVGKDVVVELKNDLRFVFISETVKSSVLLVAKVCCY